MGYEEEVGLVGCAHPWGLSGVTMEAELHDGRDNCLQDGVIDILLVVDPLADVLSEEDIFCTCNLFLARFALC